MYPSCYDCRIAFALFVLLDIIRNNSICGSLDNTTDTVGFRWTSVPSPISACTGQDVAFNWRYQTGKYEVEARTLIRYIDKNVELIAYWNHAQGFVRDAKFKDRVERIGEDGLLLKNVTPKDDHVYSLIVRIPSASPQQNVTLTVYEPPLDGCCRPTLHQLENGTGLQAQLHVQACGTPPIDFKWDTVPGVMANGSIAKFESTEVSGTVRVCVTGFAVQNCYKGDPKSLCQEQYIEKRSKTSTPEEQNVIMVAVVSIASTLLVLLVSGLLIWLLCRQKLKKCVCKEQGKNGYEETLRLTETEQEQKLEEAMEKVARILYTTYKTSRELALEEISKLQLENIELNFHGKVQPNPSYKKCLLHKKQQRKLLIIEGTSGSGKTTWCRKFLKTWCMSFKHRNDTNQGKQEEIEDIRTLGLFPLLFFVSLRDVGTSESSIDIIQRQCLKKEQLSDDLDLLIKHRYEKIIILIHGADEAKGDINILKKFLAMNCLKVVTCQDWKPIQQAFNIQSEQCETMATIRFNKIDSEFEKYAKNIFSDLNYPQNAYENFTKRVQSKNLQSLMREVFFVQPLIHIWCQYDTLPSDIAGVCLYFIQDNLKKLRKKLKSYTNLKLDLQEVATFIPRARGMIFIINYGKALKGLGKTAYNCLNNEESEDIFSEEELMANTDIKDNGLAEILIAAKLVSTAPVSNSGGKKRLRFSHPMIRKFMVAFYFAFEQEHEEDDTKCKDSEIINILNDLMRAEINS
ncbi:hypothetical protein ACJMK2_019314 [Sinanodonta woodiana]|uniref:NACHT domain-containing protein n=1 Tax=Sinanodonta woodiana TaxID=1069815 RepID=A0ABD3UJ40_SINWO